MYSTLYILLHCQKWCITLEVGITSSRQLPHQRCRVSFDVTSYKNDTSNYNTRVYVGTYVYIYTKNNNSTTLLLLLCLLKTYVVIWCIMYFFQ